MQKIPFENSALKYCLKIRQIKETPIFLKKNPHVLNLSANLSTDSVDELLLAWSTKSVQPGAGIATLKS